MLLSLTNDISVMATSFDRVHSSPTPNAWNMTACLSVAFAIAAVNAGTAVVLAIVANPNGVNWWSSWFGTSLKPYPTDEYPTNPQASEPPPRRTRCARRALCLPLARPVSRKLPGSLLPLAGYAIKPGILVKPAFPPTPPPPLSS